jgi:lecithin:retinol acyltransferase
MIKPGDVVGVAVDVAGVGVVTHKGLVSDRRGEDGYPRVLHASKFVGRVDESTMTTFVHRAVEGARLRALGYPGRLPRRLVLARARSRIGERYDLVLANCEHYVAWCHGLAPESPQLRAALARYGF